MGLIITPTIFKSYPELKAGMTLRGGKEPFGLNFSYYVGDDEKRVRDNRRSLSEKLGFPLTRLAIQKQVHGDRVVYVDESYQPSQSDALITDQEGWLLGISVADCVPILLAMPEKNVLAGIHSGWRGSAQNIVGKAVTTLKVKFGVSPAS